MNTESIDASSQHPSDGGDGSLPTPGPDQRVPAKRARRTQAMRSEDTQLKLCQAAVELLTEVGYANLTTAQIAERAGMSKGALAHHFPTKDDAVVAAIRHLVAGWETGWGAYASVAAPGDHLAQLQRELWQNIFGRLDYLAALEVVLSSRHNPALHARLREGVKGWVTARDTTFAKSIPLKDPAELSTFLALNSCVMRGLATSMEVPSDEGVPERVMALWSEMANVFLAQRTAPDAPKPNPKPNRNKR